jgi:hypothetical protein
MKRTWMALALVLMASTLIFAGQGRKKKSDVDLSTVRTVQGTVTAVSLEAGIGLPAFFLGTSDGSSLRVHLGPYWYLVSQNFSVAVGDAVSATVADCPKTPDTGDATAFAVDDLTSGASIILRNELGVPVWKAGRKGNGNGSGNGNGNGGQMGGGQGHGGGHSNGCRHGGYGVGGTVDLATLVELEGMAAAVGLGLGTHHNAITFSAGGTDYALGLGPLWYMAQQGFAVTAGDTLRVKMAQCSKGWTAFEVANLTTGQTLLLRDDQGVPLWLD